MVSNSNFVFCWLTNCYTKVATVTQVARSRNPTRACCKVYAVVSGKHVNPTGHQYHVTIAAVTSYGAPQNHCNITHKQTILCPLSSPSSKLVENAFPLCDDCVYQFGYSLDKAASPLNLTACDTVSGPNLSDAYAPIVRTSAHP